VPELVALDAVAPPAELDENALAFVQYTSGSTSDPKGVALTHRNVLAGIRAIASGIALNERDVCSLWLPLFHDMGLIGLLTGLAYGVTMYLWPPSVFLRAPAKWLADFARFGTTIYFGPNFSYEYLLANVTEEELAALDLSPWRVAFNGGEHIDPGCLQRFTGYFSAAGFRPETMFPVYGLAEATLAVTFPELGSTPRVEHANAGILSNERTFVRVDRLDPSARAIVSVGKPVLDTRVRIVDREGAEVPAGTVGEIQIAGPAVMSGYLHRDPREAVDAAGWLSTGDLGFVDGGELFVTGRAKEMIVVRGQNYYPQDVEALVRDVPGVNRGRCNAVVMAFPGHEYIALFAESASHTPADADALAQTLRVTVERALQIDAVAVYVLKRGSIRRTTSGKYQRTLMGRLLFEGDLDTAMLATRE
jgi:acyl-CoA synthetase (AMP-forming)/AMP-acid ligase II